MNIQFPLFRFFRKSVVKRVAFLLGSGISIPVGMPSTGEITESVLSGEGIARHTDGTYYFGKPMYDHVGLPDEYVPRVCEFLGILKELADQFYKCGSHELPAGSEFYSLFGRHETNYEDLYYLVNQIHDSDTHEYENPALQPLIDQLVDSDEIRALCQRRNGDTGEWKFNHLHREACSYIECVVEKLLGDKQADLTPLEMLGEAARDCDFKRMDIYTLNHDTIIEQFFEQSSIPIVDGFSVVRGDVRHWDSGFFDQTDDKVRLLKLHGSINWFRFPPVTPRWSSECVGIATNNDVWHTRNEEGGRQWPAEGARSVMLIGTFNKIMTYTTDIFADLHVQFHNGLRDVEHLVICGYGFGDKGINSRLLDWICSSPSRRAVVIDPSPHSLRRNARGAVRQSWLPLAREGKLRLISKGVEEVCWNEVHEELMA